MVEEKQITDKVETRTPIFQCVASLVGGKEKTQTKYMFFPTRFSRKNSYYFKSNSILLQQRYNIILQTIMPLLTILECKLSGDGASPSPDNSLCNTMPNTDGNV